MSSRDGMLACSVVDIGGEGSHHSLRRHGRRQRVSSVSRVNMQSCKRGHRSLLQSWSPSNHNTSHATLSPQLQLSIDPFLQHAMTIFEIYRRHFSIFLSLMDQFFASLARFFASLSHFFASLSHFFASIDRFFVHFCVINSIFSRYRPIFHTFIDDFGPIFALSTHFSTSMTYFLTPMTYFYRFGSPI